MIYIYIRSRTFRDLIGIYINYWRVNWKKRRRFLLRECGRSLKNIYTLYRPACLGGVAKDFSFLVLLDTILGTLFLIKNIKNNFFWIKIVVRQYSFMDATRMESIIKSTQIYRRVESRTLTSTIILKHQTFEIVKIRWSYIHILSTTNQHHWI